MSEPLDALSLPLWGSRLIEASAGTGKTWTIAALYLRLVLGHGDEGEAHARALVPSEILVLTFTRAATRELSDRIRARLLEAARVFRGDVETTDPLLVQLLAAHEGTARSAAAWRLAAAAESMDDAAVFTIDAWCQRMLREHAFDSGSLFDEELVPDDGVLRDEAVRDYWRQHFYRLAPAQLDVALSVWKDVDALRADMRALLPQAPRAVPGEPLGVVVDREAGRFREVLAAVQANVGAMREWLEAQYAAGCFVKSKFQPRWFNPNLDTLAAGAGSPAALRKALGDKGCERLTPTFLAEVWIGPAPLDLPPGFDTFAELMALPDWAAPLRLHAASHVAARLQDLKRQSGRFGFQDMLDRLDAALAGPNGERLRERIVAQYPVALIDEFQDTSPVQYRIFDRLYRTAANDPGTALLLIGDPKQSIYGFRGADIHSYLAARRATEGRHYVLDTNHRSTGALVSAVNHLFDLAEQRPGAGAFLLRAGGDDPLPFLSVKARGRAEHLRTAGGEVPAVTLCVDGELLDGKSIQRRFAAACAERIVTWLNDPEAGFDGGGKGFQRLRPADIAVLVRKGDEADAVRRELRRRNVASVFLSDRDSVFASPEARDLLRWLRAVVSPLDARLVRAALASDTMARTLAELAELADDDAVFDDRTESMRALQRTWLGQGVLTMLRQTLHVLSLPARWLAAPDGERRLTNYLHLAELLQSASSHLDNEHALVRWLADRIADDAEGAEEQIVRLESDADLVKVVTVHKSKGLEYPVVLLPFATLARLPSSRGHAVVSVMGAQGRELHLDPSAEVLDLADRERLQEDLRLLYVALTRARHALWVGVAAPKSGKACVVHRSALGHVLVGPTAVTEDGVVRAVEHVVAGHGEIVAERLDPEAGRTRLRRHDEPPPLRDAPAYAGKFERRWSVSSFSALVRHIGAVPLPALAGVVREDEVLALRDDDDAPLPAAATRPWHTFPRGAMPGNFLHDQLEWLADEQFGLARSEVLRERLRKRCERQGWGHRADDVLEWLGDVVSQPLPPLGVALDGIEQRLPEMEFWFPSDALPTAEVDRLCQLHLLNGAPRPPLPERELRGLLMGFADLVFFHGGKYWVLDYKSNALGTRDGDYTAAALEASMAEHRYDVQAALYMLALHRLLAVRIGASYDPAQHLGGAVYLYLRGVHGPAGGCCHVPADPVFLDALDTAFGSPR